MTCRLPQNPLCSSAVPRCCALTSLCFNQTASLLLCVPSHHLTHPFSCLPSLTPPPFLSSPLCTLIPVVCQPGLRLTLLCWHRLCQAKHQLGLLLCSCPPPLSSFLSLFRSSPICFSTSLLAAQPQCLYLSHPPLASNPPSLSPSLSLQRPFSSIILCSTSRLLTSSPPVFLLFPPTLPTSSLPHLP